MEDLFQVECFSKRKYSCVKKAISSKQNLALLRYSFITLMNNMTNVSSFLPLVSNVTDFDEYYNFNDLKDFFEPMYMSVPIRILTIQTYLLSLIPCGIIGVLIWFEQSGKAGHFRTLVNQLVTFNLYQVSLFLY